jgi:hypothetical protein
MEIAAKGSDDDNQYSDDPEEKFPYRGGSAAFLRDRRYSPGGIISRPGFRHGQFSIRKLVVPARLAHRYYR